MKFVVFCIPPPIGPNGTFSFGPFSGAPALANALRNNDATPEPFQCTGESKGERMDDNGKDHWK